MKISISGGMLVLLFAVFLLLPESGLDEREAVSAWIVRDDTAISGSPREIGRAVRANLYQLQERIEEQPQTPFYSILLDTWVMFAGESIVALRYISALLIMLALVIMTRMSSWIILPVAAMLFIYPAVTAYAYGLLLLLSVLSSYCLLHIMRRYMQILYTISLLLAISTHGSAVILVVLHIALYYFATRRQGMISRPVLAWLIAGGAWLFLALPTPDFLIGAAVILLPFAAVIILRLMTYGELNRQYAFVAAAIILLLLTGVLTAWTIMSKPDWVRRIELLNLARRHDEPMLISYEPKSALAHYDRQEKTAIRRFITVDVGWREFSYDELTGIMANMDNATAVWVLMHKDDPVTWDVLDMVAAERVPVYRIEEHGMLFYRFDRQKHDPRFE